MRIKKLEIFGFKSFANRQSLNFGEGLTGIVGPNGCGKSNVVDALRWVMGEQNARHLRGGNMQDIIFCGSEKKAALGFAEVSLTIDNDQQDAPLDYNHYSEIQITRRLYKSGESEYEINRQKARLKDISEFFMGTGVGTKAYSIIEQGRVNEVISAKPQDRRAIIEEAAGITKYKSKKAAAERRMETTRANLNRIIDIRNEIDKRVTALLRDKEKLDRVNIHKANIRNLDFHIASHQYLAILAEQNYLLSLKAKEDIKNTELNREIAVIEHSFSQILAEYSHQNEQKRVLEDLLAQHRNSAALLEKDLAYTKQALTDNQAFIGRVENQTQDLSKREAELSKDIANFETQHQESILLLNNLNKLIAEKKSNGSEVINARQQNLLAERDTQAKLVSTAANAARMQAQIQALDHQEYERIQSMKTLEQELNQKTSDCSELSERHKALDQEYKLGQDRETLLKADLLKEEQTISVLEKNRHELSKQLEIILDNLRQTSSRLNSIKEIDAKLEWSDSGISTILSSKERDILKGVVADAVSVLPGQEKLVEKCISHLLDTGLLAKKEDLKKAVQILHNKSSSTTNFYILEDQDAANPSKPLGLKNLSDIIIIKNNPSLHSKLSRYFIAEDLNSALDHWSAARLAQAFIVTPAGELLRPDGQASILGAANNQGVLQRKNEQIALEQKLSVLLTERENQELLIKTNKENLINTVEQKNIINQELKPLSLGLIRLDESLKQKTRDLERLKIDLSRLNDKLLALKATALNNDDKKSSLQTSWAEALNEHRLLEASLENIKKERVATEYGYEQYQSQLRELELSQASCQEKFSSLKKACDQALKAKDHILAQQEILSDEVINKNNDELKLKESIRQTDKKIENLEREIKQCEHHLAGLITSCTELGRKKNELELNLAQQNLQKATIQKQSHERELLATKLEHELKTLNERIFERYQAILSHQLSDYHHQPLNPNTAKRELEELKRTLERLGSVNENADQEYNEFKARKDFLDNQISDLEQALSQLENAIKKINKTTALRFNEAFLNINKQFSQVFPRLFNGGKAELVLTDNEDLLSCGVDIMAKPPGKNIGSIELMSGGEKALTAISLIMAIFLIKPSPFCLLDEVDAPLDEANVSRFSQLIREMSELSQFIVITHNRKTMESADQLYGVTMEDAGMSKIVSVHVQQAFESFKQAAPKLETKPSKPTQLNLGDCELT